MRALPRDDRDLFIAASNGHVLAFDNVSGLPAWISDTLCRLATGGGFAVRLSLLKTSPAHFWRLGADSLPSARLRCRTDVWGQDIQVSFNRG